VVSRAAGLHDNRAALQLFEEGDQLNSLQFAPDHRLPRLVDSVNLEGGLGSIQTNHANVHRGWLPYLRLSRPASWHIDAGGGRPPHLLEICKPVPDYAAFSADRGGVQIGNFGVVAKG
jgi:hypothetical protein